MRIPIAAVVTTFGLLSVPPGVATADDDLFQTPSRWVGWSQPSESPTGTAQPCVTPPPGTDPCVAASQLSALPPFGGPLCERSKLTGDWLGTRNTLRDRGIDWNIYSTNFYQGTTTGGQEQAFRFGGRADYLLHVDGQKAGLWQGFFIDLHGETNYGQSANNLTGALLPVSLAQALPTPNTPVTALTGVKFTQALSEKFLVFFGKLNLLDGFNQPFTGGARGVNGFMNTGMLFNPVYARTAPYSTYGAGFAVLQGMEPVLSLLVLDPNNTPTTSGFDTFFDRGVSIITQANLPTKFFDLPGHQGVGGSYSNSSYRALDNIPIILAQRLRGQLPTLPRETGSWTVTYSFDQAFWVDSVNSKRSWGAFGNAGISDGNPNPIKWFVNVGIGGSSPLSSRPLDSFGVGYYYLGLSDDLKAFPRLLPLGDEQGVELFYNIAVTPWFHLTPDLQVVIPTRDRVDASLLFGLRAKIDF